MMTPIHAILILIIRIWAAGVIINAIGNFPLFMVSMQIANGGQVDSMTISYALNYAVWIFSGVAAWIIAPMLAKLVYSKPQDTSVDIVVDADVLVMLGSFLIGGFYLVQYVPELLTNVGETFIAVSREDTSQGYETNRFVWTGDDIERLVKEGLIIIVALWMALRPGHVAYIFSRLRRAGLYKKDAQK